MAFKQIHHSKIFATVLIFEKLQSSPGRFSCFINVVLGNKMVESHIHILKRHIEKTTL
jgi:hypothetical protein